MNYIDISDLAEASSFRRRLVPCVAQAAGTILAEAPTGKYAFDMKRNDLARTALRDPVDVAALFVWGVLSNPSIAQAGLEAPDGDLLYQVIQMWSTISGVTEAEENETPIEPPTELIDS